LGTPSSGTVTNLTGTASININGTVGATTPAAGSFTNLSYTGTLTGGTGVIDIGSGQVYKDASGNVGIGTSSPASGYKISVNGVGNFYSGVSGLGRVFLGDPSDYSGYIGLYRSTLGPSNSTTAGNGLNFASIDGYTFNTGAGVAFGSQTERMRIDTSGNVGIGTSSPSANLDVYANVQPNIRVRNSNGITDLYALSNGDGFLTSQTAGKSLLFGTLGAEKMRIDSSGNVGIGTSSPNAKLQVNGAVVVGTPSGGGIGVGNDATTFTPSGASKTIPNYGFGDIGSGIVGAAGYFGLTYYTNQLERMRIDSSGNLLVGTTSTIQSGKVSVATATSAFTATTSAGAGAGIGLDLQRTAANGDIAYFRSTSGLAGYITITGANTCTYNSVSDVRLKENIVNAPSALAKVESLQVRSFDWKDGTGSVPFGFIAQELNEVVPEAVSHGTTNEDGSMLTPWGIDTSLLVPYLTKAIQEQQAIIEQLKADVAALKGKV
jgi:hypothetical protein